MTKDSNGVHFCMCASVFLMRACIPHDNGAALGIIGCAELRLRRQRERETSTNGTTLTESMKGRALTVNSHHGFVLVLSYVARGRSDVIFHSSSHPFSAFPLSCITVPSSARPFHPTLIVSCLLHHYSHHSQQWICSSLQSSSSSPSSSMC